ncbi:hypothetical protein K438DRAFT_1760288 [Mycena galopus ATCC 62051]|nr:hypothetical protein K438DRAFT_1760288 [Mycena galopus ATCC 62051]
MPPLFIPEKTDKLLELLIPYDVRKEGGERLQERLRNLFDVGARIGHQQNAKEVARAREEGYEAGRREGLKERHGRTFSEASVSSSPADSVSAATQTETHRSTRMSCLPSLPCLASFSTTAMQTDPPSFSETTTLPLTISMQTEVPIPTPSSHPTPSPVAPSRPSPTVHDADSDVHEAPKTPSHDLRPPSPFSVRDFSDLRTGTPHPFASLQRRHRRAPHAFGPHSSPPRSSRTPKTIILNIYDSNPETSRVRYTTRSAFAPRSHPRPPTSTFDDQNLRLDWGLDPRLRDLSRALTALGWVRPG